MIFIVSKHVHI